MSECHAGLSLFAEIREQRDHIVPLSNRNPPISEPHG